MKKNLLIKLVLTISLFAGGWISLRAQCTITGLNANYCTNSPSSTLSAGSTTGGIFSGPGMTGAVFSPSLAGAGTKTITFSVCSPTYAVTGGTGTAWYNAVPMPTNTSGPEITNTVSLTDDAVTGTLSIGFPFKFFCNTYSAFNISSNGFITFGSTVNGCCTGQSLPSTTTPNDLIAVAWEDFNPGSGGTISYATVGTTPNRTLLVTYDNVPHFGSGGGPLTAQIKLFETTNVIEIHTYSMVTDGGNHTQGIENNGGTAAYTVTGRNSSSWSAVNDMQRFTPGTSCLVTQTTVVSPSTISVVGTNSICNGSTATLTANGNTTYTWSTGSNAAAINPAPTTNQTYSVSGTNSFGCVANSVITVTVDNTPTVTATASNGSGVCPGKTVTVTGGGATSYTWTGNTTTVTNGVAFTPTTTDTYTVTGLNTCGTSTAAVTVSIHPLPTVTPVASSSSLCSGTSLTLTGVGNATNYVWSGSAVNGVGFSPSTSSTYTVIGTSALSCTASATIPITVVATPSIASAVSPSLICIGKSSTLTASGAGSYNWSGDLLPATTNSYVVTPLNPGINTYTIVRANSTCTTSQIVTVIVNALPVTFAIASPTVVCAGKPTSLTVAGGQTYTWTSPGNPPTVPSFTFTGATPLAFPPVSSIYTVSAHDGTCVNTTTVFVQADPNPTIITTAMPSTLCSGGTATINATGGLSYTVTSSSSTNSYVAFPITETLTNSTAFNISGDNSFGCITSTVQFVQVFPVPTLTVSVSKPLICSGGSVAVVATGANVYSWSSGALTASTIVNPTSLVSGPVIYTVTGTFTNTQCQSEKTVAVNIFIPTITVTGNTATCINGIINLTAGGGTGNNYLWYTIPGSVATSSTSQTSSTVNAAAVFTISVLTTSGTAVLCPATKTVDISIYFNPTITATATRTQICVKESIVLTATGGVTYFWTTGSPTQTISVSPNSTTIYTVTGTDINNCSSTGTIQVKVSGCSGIAEQNPAAMGLNIYPNPSNGEFVIESPVALKLTLVNDIGQLIRVIELSGTNNYKVYVNDLAKGIYFLTGQKDNVQVSQKVIITR
ncbi:hypothetical protein CNR22_14370 [Sphingobacteriaceae bacterium]|nr:hypothetical protein CNR22_14370 [Sphingobacteriaceae bacterium]